MDATVCRRDAAPHRITETRLPDTHGLAAPTEVAEVVQLPAHTKCAGVIKSKAAE